jgi:hypothetical protein
MADTRLSPKYSLVRYWRYVFAPLILVLLVMGWYVFFNLPPSQLSVGPLPALPADLVSMAAPAAAVAVINAASSTTTAAGKPAVPT